MSVQWTPRERQPDVPVVNGALWRGVLVALPLSAALWVAIITLVRLVTA